MKILVTSVRIFVGILFIISGLVKANDPLGLTYKMQEFFEVWGLHQFNSSSLLLSVLLNAFEIIAGFALMLGWRIKLFIWLLFTMIAFFTFLTGYTYITGVPKNCGCFGDCIPISSKTSFLKDILLLVLISFLIWKQQYIKPFLSEKKNTLLMLVITLLSFGFQWFTLNYLPVVDCLPYKKGNNITEKMKMPANAIPDSTVITFIYKKDGKEVEFTADKFPSDFNAQTYQFINRYDKIVRKGKNNEPPIKGFSLSGESNIDSTQFVLAEPYTVLLFSEKFADAGTDWKNRFAEIYHLAKQKGISSFLITNEPGKASAFLSGSSFSGIQVFKCDNKVMQTAARTNPCLLLLKSGTILGKWSKHRFGSAKKMINKISLQPSAGN